MNTTSLSGTKSLPFIICLLFLVSCDTTIPSATIGSGGFKVAGSGKDPYQIYTDEYGSFNSNALRVQNAIVRSNPPNHMAAAGYVKDIIGGLKIMHDLVEDDTAQKLQVYIQKYESIYQLLSTNRYNAATISDLERCEVEIKSSFRPSQVRLKQIVQPEPESKPEPKKISEPQGTSAASWIFYKAWEQTHQQLEQKWLDSKDCESEYQRVIEALNGLKNSLPAEDHPRIQTCIDSYMNTYNKTNGLKDTPEETTREEILNDLRAPASIIRQFYTPDK